MSSVFTQVNDIQFFMTLSLRLSRLFGQIFWVYLGVKTCEVFLCFIPIIFVLSIVLTF